MTEYDPEQTARGRHAGPPPEEPYAGEPYAEQPYLEEPYAYSQEPVVQEYDAGGRRRRGRSGMGCVPVAILLVVIALVAGFGVWKGVGLVKDRFAGPEDYTGDGHGKVVFEVKAGDTAADMGRGLKAAGVVKSVEAFTDAAAAAEPESRKIQVGTYTMKKEMSAAAALAVLIDPGNLVKNLVTIPEGLRVVDIVALLVDKTGIPQADFDKWLARADELGLPDYAEGNPEGYLFPATYELGTDPTAKKILTAMIARWQQAADDADLEGMSAELGYTPAELMTIAGLVEAEARPDDMSKVARVIYNRLENPGTAGTIGRLEIDATVNYALNRRLGVTLTSEDKAVDSPYNTYANEGLPPGPIEAPGDDAIKAATHPADGDWYYYVTVNLRTGETKFAESYDEFLQYKAEYTQYCETSKAC